MLKCLIVDDEELARKRVRKLLEKHSRFIFVYGEFSDAGSLLNYLEEEQVDCIFLDIEMPGLNGIQVLQKIPESVHVIFTTAYKEFALEAFEHQAFDYLLKPISQSRLDKSLLRLQSTGTGNSGSRNPNDEVYRKEQFPVNTKDGTRFISVSDIAYFSAESKYVKLHTVSGEHYLLPHSLNLLEKRLETFCRIQKSLLVNSKHIHEIKGYFNSRYKIVLNDVLKTVLISGRAFPKNISGLMEI